MVSELILSRFLGHRGYHDHYRTTFKQYSLTLSHKWMQTSLYKPIYKIELGLKVHY